jgi:hypothetical protein
VCVCVCVCVCVPMCAQTHILYRKELTLFPMGVYVYVCRYIWSNIVYVFKYIFNLLKLFILDDSFLTAVALLP